MKAKAIAMVLVGGRGTRLQPITRRMAKPAVSFGGKYKLIDFVLSNLTNAAIDTVGVITQYEPHSLMDYIEHGSTWDLDLPDGGIHFLTPYTSYEGDVWQKGTAHAIRQHMRFIRSHDPEYVLILSGDHIYKMDYNHLIDVHAESGADFTISAFSPHDSLSRYGVLNVDDDNRVRDFEEKPKKPEGHYASMGVYVFNTEALKRILTDSLEEGFDFGKDIIPRALDEGYTINAYHFDGYFRDVGTIESLFEANMDLIDHPELLKLHDYKELPVYTRSSDLPPHHITTKEPLADVLIGDGCLVSGKIRRSILSNGVVVKDGAHVENSVLFQGATIGEGAVLKNAMILEDTLVMPGTELVYDEVEVIDNDRLWKLGGDGDA